MPSWRGLRRRDLVPGSYPRVRGARNHDVGLEGGVGEVVVGRGEGVKGGGERSDISSSLDTC